jgi:UDP-N-acetylglucosamine 2-epimerase (non-hydrolysing)
MQKVCIILGTRPEAIKMAPVIIELRKHPHDFEVTVCTTGQHTTMLDSALNAFNIMPDVKLDVMRPGQSLAQLTSGILLALDMFFEKLQPNIVLVHGDTTSAMVASLAAFYRQIEIGHVESGLRTQNLNSPFPEEFNRRSIAIAAGCHFAPTEAARINLEREGVRAEKVIVTGNTVIDALHLTVSKLQNSPEEHKIIRNQLISKLGFDPEQRAFVLITAHRRENFGTGIENICLSIIKLAKNNPNTNFVYPVHLNPKIKNTAESRLGKIPNVVLLEPLDYRSFSWLLFNCLFVLTDSGGIQEEAPSLGKPVLVMRDTSERPEAIEAGTAKLVSTVVKTIIEEVQTLISNKVEYDRMARAVNPFGDGTAARKIAEYLLKVKRLS